ncbi:Innexin inx2 [Orchesella cincta]|uniref:Innexin n=1 Tax=Orchesella cincta TaxID=48709 RepID=A0A1D2NFI7_ORCCI|nr:Innexin inx2 [Orchesella cincta]
MHHGKQHNYYQWLPLLLILQALLTYIPTWLWNNLKDSRIQETVSSVKDSSKPASRRKLLIINLANDLFTQVIQKRYAKPFILCESLNIFCFIVNVVLTNFFFHNRFIMYGIKEIWMRFSSLSFRSQDSELFPQFGKCSFNLVKKDEIQKEAVCMISFNSLCENIYMVWFVVLIFASVIGLTFRLFGMFSRRKRRKLLMDAADNSCDENLQKICEKIGFYSWFTLYRISRNVDPLTFQDIISSLVARIESMPVFKTIKVRSRAVEHHTSDEIHDNISTVV